MTKELDREFQSIMDDWSSAIVANDPGAIGSFAEPYWLLVGATGVIPREQFLSVVETGLLAHDSMCHDVQLVRLHGDVAVVVSRVKNTGVFDGEKFVQDESATEVFVRRGDSWKCSVTQLTGIAETGQ